MFKVNNKNTRATSLTYFTPFSSVFIAAWNKQILGGSDPYNLEL